MIELSHLTENAYTTASTETGYLRQAPVALQQTLGIAMLEHISVDAARILKATVRSKTDLMYLMETLGVCFGFSAAEYSGSIRKALDVYRVMLTRPLVDQLRIFEDRSVLEDVLVAAIRQMTLVAELRHDFPAGSVPQVQLIARMADHVSKMIATHEDVLSLPVWNTLLKVSMGLFDYVCATGKLPLDCCQTVGSVAFEALVRSRTRSPEIWALYHARLPNHRAAATQWSVVVVALTRAAAAVATRRALPPCIPLAWRGVMDAARQVSNVTSYTAEDVVFLWKKLCVLLNPLRLLHVAALDVASEAVRDSVMILSAASYWPSSMGDARCADINAELNPCSRRIPLGLSTESVLRVWGDISLHVAQGTSSKLNPTVLPLASLDVSRSRAVEAICALMLRRESETQCPTDYWRCFARVLEDISDGSSAFVRGVALLQLPALFLHDLPWPYGVLRKFCQFACEVLAELSDGITDGGDEDDEDGASAKGQDADASKAVEDDPANLDDSASEGLRMRFAAILCATNVAVLSIEFKDATVFHGVMTAFAMAAERYLRLTSVLQRILCAAALLSRHARATSSDAVLRQRCDEVVSGMVKTVLDMLRAPCGLYDAPSLVVALRFVGWSMESLDEAAAISAAVQICEFSASARRVLDSAKFDDDVTTLCSLFCIAVDVMVQLLLSNHAYALRTSDAVAAALVGVLEAGFKALPHAQALNVREASHRLLRAMDSSGWWPMDDGVTDTSSPITEADLKSICVSIRTFALGSSRVVTLAQLDAAKCCTAAATSPDDGATAAHPQHCPPWAQNVDVVMIVRSPHGRRAWAIRKHVVPRPETSTSRCQSPRLGSISASFAEAPPLETLSLDGSAGATTHGLDCLRFVDGQTRTENLLKAWASSPELQRIQEELQPSFPLTMQDTNHDASPEFSVQEDVGSANSVFARQWMHDMGFAHSRYKELPFNVSLVRQLKTLDQVDERTAVSVQLLYVTDSLEQDAEAQPSGGAIESRAAFERLCAALGHHREGEGTGIGKGATPSSSICYVTPTHRLSFVVSHKSLQELATEDDSAGANSSPSTANHAQQPPFTADLACVRIIWDASSSRFDWTAVESEQHRLLRRFVCPSMRKSEGHSSFDVVLRPLLGPGYFAVQLLAPEAAHATGAHPAMWGAPLLHGVIASAVVLPRLLQDAVMHGICQLHTSVVTSERSLLLLSMLHDLPVLPPSQVVAVELTR